MIMWQVGMTLESLEQHAIEQAMKFYSNNKTATATSLGIAIRTLDSKLSKYESERFQRDLTERKRIEDRTTNLSRQRGEIPPQGILSASAGMRVEPASQAPAEQEMSVSERPQVQEVLHGQTSKGRNKGSRAAV